MTDSISISSDGNSVAFSVGHTFVVYSTSPLLRKFSKEFASYHITKISTTEDGTFVAFVGISENDESNPMIFVWNNFYAECHSKIELDGKVLNIKILGQLLLIVMEKKTCIFDLQNKMMKIEVPTDPNPCGAGDISIYSYHADDEFDDSEIDNDVSFVAIAANEPGKINVYKMTDNPSKISIYAAKHSVNLIKFSPDAAFVATASAKGTLIRLFDSKTGAALSTFRRGTLSPASVLDVALSPSKTELVAISSNGTVHLFKADVRNANQSDFPRSISKLSIDKPSFVAAAFKNDHTLLIVLNSGQLLTVKISNESLELGSKALLLEH